MSEQLPAETKLPLTCNVRRGVLTISVNSATVKFATENHPDFWNPENETYRLKVADKTEWLRSVVQYINEEREDGSSLLSDLFDQAIREAVEQGAEGLADED